MHSNESTATTDCIASNRSRRAVLSLGAAGLVSALAGCSSIGGQSTPGTSTPDGVFEDISFEGPEMIVQLTEGHSVERLNLIGPDGSRFASSEVNTGESRVPVTILEIAAGEAEHYPIGTSTLVAVTNDSQQSTDIQLIPNLEITGVSQHSGESPKSYGNVEVTVFNRGTGPTWVYEVYYENSPNPIASTTSDGRGTPTLYLMEPDSKSSSILLPGESREFVGQYPPFIFSEQTACQSKEYTATAVVKTGAKKSIRSRIIARYSGDAVRADAVGHEDQYACKSGSITIDLNNQ